MQPDQPVPDLPVNECLGEVIAQLRTDRPVILRAPPGAGKTTGVPPAILQQQIIDGRILLLQPRRLAARAAAHRLSRLAGQRVGKTYGYNVRFDRVVGPQTRVIAMTTGILLRQLSTDPFLEDIGCVILDEFHERSLEIDLALGMLQRLRSTVRPELKLVVMSATLETEPVERLLEDAVVIESQGRAFEVEIRYEKSLTRPSTRPSAVADQVASRMSDALGSTDGDVLVFLPGVGEIHRTEEALAGLARKHQIELFKLYGDLSPQQQDAVLAPSNGRKIVLSTNVAETSVTLPGITCVIDTGLARTMQFDPSVGLPSLRLQPISQASADQRAGRAGRTAAGVCYRLWPAAMHRSRPEHTPPEIAGADLSSALLMLAAWGERDVMEFPWVTPPENVAVAAAHNLLIRLEAIDRRGTVTSIGKQINQLPLHPRLSRLMLAAEQLGCVREASLVAALLSERSPFDRFTEFRFRPQRSGEECDLFERAERLKQHFDGRRDDAIDPGAAKNIARVASQLLRCVESADTSHETMPPMAERIARALLAAYPDRLAKRRAAGSASGVIVGGRGVRLEPSSTVRTSDLFLCIDVDGKGTESRVRLASAVDEAWLPESAIETRTERFFHPSLKAVVARDRRYVEDLMLDESPAQCPVDEHTANLLASRAASQLDQILPTKDKTLHSFLSRWRFLSDNLPDSVLPGTVDDLLARVLENLCQTRTSFKELAEAPWLDYVKAELNYDQLQWFEKQAPETMQVPSGNRIRLEYPPGKRPVLAVRIQEIFGWTKTPRLAGGSVPIQLHLLGPNHRPQQITDDLESFWKTTYGEIRKELKRRYAKHHWPDNPATAKATRNGLKPRG